MKKRAPLSITGIGCLSAAGFGLEQTRQNLFQIGSCEISNEVCFEMVGAEFPFAQINIPPSFDISANSSPNAGSGVHSVYTYAPNILALQAVSEALQAAGLRAVELQDLRVGVCIGSTVGGTNYQSKFNHPYFRRELPPADSFFDYYQNNSAQFLAKHFGLKGPIQLINNACTSGADAVGIGASWIERGLCDIVICGGVEKILPKMCYGFRALRLYAPNACQPFDRNRQGLTMGDGAGVLILERANSARRPLAKFLGYGVGSDAYHPTSPHPEARGLDLAVRSCLLQAELKQYEISFINAHGTATPHNDLVEGGWIKRKMPDTPVVATKGFTGHTLAAAGALEAIFSILSFESERLPKSKGFSEMDPDIGISPTTRILKATRERPLNSVLSFSLGFGGANTALCLGRAT